MTLPKHIARVFLLMALVAALLGWTAKNTAILFADGLRYIDQARRLDTGPTLDGLFRSIDHPAYPLAIAGMHRVLGGSTPIDWQHAGQAASILAGILLVIPLYLVAAEMFGGSAAWLAVVFSFLVPLTGHVFSDTLSESLFLLFFTMGVWTSLRFLREGTFGWLPPTVGFAALAYWVRPEGLLLPAAMVATLGIIPLMSATRLHWPRWWAAVAFLVIGPACLIAPIIASKGGLSTKPAVGRVLGTAPKSASLAVERQRPLDPDQSTAKTYLQATRAMAFAVRDAVTIPLLPLALLGLIFSWPPGERSRPWVFLATVMIAWALAMIRLHATSGYCTPRHSMILAFPLIASAAFGLIRLMGMVSIPGTWVGRDDGRYTAGPLIWGLIFAGLVSYYRADLSAPVNDRFLGYRGAADYLESNVPEGERVVDLTGWSLYYSGRKGYTFGNLIEAMGDRSLSRVVVREAHLKGPWEYCQQVRQLIGDRAPVATYPEVPTREQDKVLVFDWSEGGKRTAQAPAAGPRQ
ncbi:ArnT family glycosyltransferase [Tundrisphaera lichenicola]|uniref:ArnT family glycosyltransferase n=1 Tax=Tundrisphaera lichenicola TaxID=2029860 RepID=UPI003EB9AD4C